jgi:hypothetical protein
MSAMSVEAAPPREAHTPSHVVREVERHAGRHGVDRDAVIMSDASEQCEQPASPKLQAWAAPHGSPGGGSCSQAVTDPAHVQRDATDDDVTERIFVLTLTPLHISFAYNIDADIYVVSTRICAPHVARSGIDTAADDVDTTWPYPLGAPRRHSHLLEEAHAAHSHNAHADVAAPDERLGEGCGTSRHESKQRSRHLDDVAPVSLDDDARRSEGGRKRVVKLVLSDCACALSLNLGEDNGDTLCGIEIRHTQHHAHMSDVAALSLTVDQALVHSQFAANGLHLTPFELAFEYGIVGAASSTHKVRICACAQVFMWIMRGAASSRAQYMHYVRMLSCSEHI